MPKVCYKQHKFKNNTNKHNKCWYTAFALCMLSAHCLYRHTAHLTMDWRPLRMPPWQWAYVGVRIVTGMGKKF